jgi:hypothetical protein
MGIGALLRLLVVTAATWELFGYLAWVVVDGLRTGAIRHTDSSKRCRRADNPAGFWALVLLFSLYVAGCAACWLMAVANVLS